MKPKIAHIRFYAELNDFLPRGQRFRDILHLFEGSPGIKDVIEGLGVPHPEVDLILAGGESVGFDYRLRSGDRIAVYPVFEGLDISPVQRLRPEPLRRPRFIADCHLGKLTRRLRMLGFEVIYRNDFEDLEIIRRSRQERLIILTRDRDLLKHGAVTHGYWVRSTQPAAQVREVLRRFDLWDRIRPFSRCTACGGTVAAVEKARIEDRLPTKTRKHYERFFECGDCGKVYWEGAHFKRLRAMVAEMRDPACGDDS